MTATAKTKAIYQGIVTRSARLTNLDDAPGGSKEAGSLQKIYSIKGLSTGKDLTDAQLAKINSYAIVPLTKDQVHYCQLLMAHNGIDRDVERFDENLLADFATTLPGKGFFVEGHPGGWSGSGGPGEGLHFDCRVIQMTPEEFKAKTGETIKLPDGVGTVHALISDAYVLALDSNSDTRKKINAGIIRYSSIGFKAPFYSITDDNGNHIYGEYRVNGEALEGSLVWLGAQPGAGVMKGAKHTPSQHELSKGEINAMDKQLLIIGTKLGRIFTAEKFADEILALIGEKDVANKALTDQVALLTLDAADGKAFRKSLIEDLIKAGVLLEDIKTDEASQKAEETYLMTVPIERLKTMSSKAMAAARAKFPDKFQIPAADQSDRAKQNEAAEQGAGGQAAGEESPVVKDAKKRAEAAAHK